MLLSNVLSAATLGACLTRGQSGAFWNITDIQRTRSSSSSQAQISIVGSESSSASTLPGFADYILHGLQADGSSQSTPATVTLISTRTSFHTIAPTEPARKNVTSTASGSELSTDAAPRTLSKTGSLLGSGTAISAASATLPPNATMTIAPNMAYYHNTTFLTVCPSSDVACYSTCQALAVSCWNDNEAWEGSAAVYQKSMVSRYDGGTTPNITITNTGTNTAKTYWSYQTSWSVSLLVTSDPGQYVPNGLDLYTTTTVTEANGEISTSKYFKTDIVTYTLTFSQAIAGGDGRGTPTSTYTENLYYETITEPSSYPFHKPRPSCSIATHQWCSFASDCDKCTISGGTVQLIYFPTTRTTSGQIAANTTSPEPTGLVTAVYRNMTMTSPTVYISFDKAYAQNECGKQVGKVYPGAILPMNVSDLSSVNGGYGTFYVPDPTNPYVSTPSLRVLPFTLADLNWPPPVSAYSNQLKYQMGREIFSIITWPYNPILEVPPQIRSMDPVSFVALWEGASIV